MGPCRRAAAWHHAGTFQSALFTTGNTGTHIQLALTFNIRGAANCVWKVAVATINKNIAVVKQRQQFGDHIIHSLPGLDHHKDLTGLFQLTYQFLQRVASDNFFSCGAATDKVIHLFRCTVIDSNSEAF